MIDIFRFINDNKLQPATSLVQVGASVGQELELFIENGIEDAILIEPLQEPFEMLKARCAGKKGYIPVNCLVGAVDNEVKEFFIASNFGQSSSVFKPTRHLEVYPWVEFNDKIFLESFSLDTVVGSVRSSLSILNEGYDLLFLDVQGAELEVFKGAARLLSRVSYIYTEVTFGTDYEHAVSYDRIIQFLDFFDFKCSHMEIDPNFVNHGNAIFVRNKVKK